MIENQNNTPLISLKLQGKDTKKTPQTQQVNKAFFDKPKTTLQVSIETGIYRANITRYVGKWKKADKIVIVRKGICPISKRNKVQFLTTNKDLFPRSRQLNLFEQPTNNK